jgi:hypothetical protein
MSTYDSRFRDALTKVEEFTDKSMEYLHDSKVAKIYTDLAKAWARVAQAIAVKEGNG